MSNAEQEPAWVEDECRNDESLMSDVYIVDFGMSLCLWFGK
jgi:hypothetical protein